MNNYLTTKEIAKLLKVNEVTVRRWIQRGKLPAIRFGREYRINEQDLEKYGNFGKRNKDK